VLRIRAVRRTGIAGAVERQGSQEGKTADYGNELKLLAGRDLEIRFAVPGGQARPGAQLPWLAEPGDVPDLNRAAVVLSGCITWTRT
jgi:hypothetical protein